MLELADALPAQIAVLDEEGVIVSTNRAWKLLAQRCGPQSSCPDGGQRNYLAECRAAAARGCRDAIMVAEGIEAVLRGERKLFTQSYPCPVDGMYCWYQISVAPAPSDMDGRAIVMHTDVTAMQHDGLTGLANRDLFEAQLELLLNGRAQDDAPVGVLMIDLDKFKQVNDTHGHVAGDELLIEVARRLRRCVRDCDLPARLGGDEFTVALGALEDAGTAERVAARVIEALGAPFRCEGKTLDVGASAGIALWPRNGDTATALLRAADRALYVVKQSGGERYEHAS